MSKDKTFLRGTWGIISGLKSHPKASNDDKSPDSSIPVDDLRQEDTPQQLLDLLKVSYRPNPRDTGTPTHLRPL